MAAQNPKPRPDSERLRALYWDEQKSLAEIGKMFNTSRALVHKWMRADGTPIRSIGEGTSLAQRGRMLSPEHKASILRNLAKGRAAQGPESRRKQAESMRGKPAWNKGKPHSPEHAEKLRAARNTEEYRRKASERLLGEKSPWWRGGVKAEHNRRLDRAEWRRRRREVYERDGWMCQDCSAHCLNSRDAKAHQKRKIQAHHIIARRNGGADELDNLVTLCVSCHHKRERALTG